MTVEELKNVKISLGITNKDIADKSGVPLGTIQKIFAGVTSAPRRKTLLAIEKALKTSYSYEGSSTSSVVSDIPSVYMAGTSCSGKYDRQGTYTIDDYYALPDDKRVELIDGVIYDMTAPLFSHQTIILEVAFQLRQCERKGDNCIVGLSPLDVQLDRDNRTMVQPDLIILCDPAKNIDRCVYGAPDFVLEVLSPSTRKKDMTLKLHKYCSAGCREYWIVDPASEHIYVYLFDEDDNMIHIYTFDDKVPVGISGGRCEVDFSKIKERLTWGFAPEAE